MRRNQFRGVSGVEGDVPAAFAYRSLFKMTAQREIITRLVAQLQQAGSSYVHDNPSMKGYLLHTISVLQREIEGPTAYLFRTRLSVQHTMLHIASRNVRYACVANRFEVRSSLS